MCYRIALGEAVGEKSHLVRGNFTGSDVGDGDVDEEAGAAI